MFVDGPAVVVGSHQARARCRRSASSFRALGRRRGSGPSCGETRVEAELRSTRVCAFDTPRAASHRAVLRPRPRSTRCGRAPGSRWPNGGESRRFRRVWWQSPRQSISLSSALSVFLPVEPLARRVRSAASWTLCVPHPRRTSGPMVPYVIRGQSRQSQLAKMVGGIGQPETSEQGACSPVYTTVQGIQVGSNVARVVQVLGLVHE